MAASTVLSVRDKVYRVGIETPEHTGRRYDSVTVFNNN